MMVKRPRKHQLVLALEGISGVLRNLWYSWVWLVSVVLLMQMAYWAMNFTLFWYLMTSKLPFGDKSWLIVNGFRSLIEDAGTVHGVLLLLVIILQALALTLLIYLLRHRARLGRRAVGGTVAGSIGAALSLGCAACGTSLLAPIVALVVSSASVAAVEAVGFVILGAALGAVSYACLQLGYSVYPLVAHHSRRDSAR